MRLRPASAAERSSASAHSARSSSICRNTTSFSQASCRERRRFQLRSQPGARASFASSLPSLLLPHPMSRPSTSRLARSPTPDYALDNSGDDVLPLAFDSEDELLDVLARLRDGLVTRARGTWEEKTQGKGGEEGWRAVEGVVGRVSAVSRLGVCCFLGRAGGEGEEEGVRGDRGGWRMSVDGGRVCGGNGCGS